MFSQINYIITNDFLKHILLKTKTYSKNNNHIDQTECDEEDWKKKPRVPLNDSSKIILTKSEEPNNDNKLKDTETRDW